MIKVDHAEELSKQQKKIDRLVKEVQNLRAHSSAVRMDKSIGVEQSQDYEFRIRSKISIVFVKESDLNF